MSSAKKNYTRITTKSLSEMKANGEKIAMLTAYDFTLAGIVDQAGIDIILVGDSASNVMAGHETTLPITLDQMIYHASSVVRVVERALVVVDLPFGTYQADSKEALRSAIRIMKESGAHAVKLEGGKQVKESIERILKAGIPVMGHLGLTPQSIYKFGTYTVRAKEEEEANKLISKFYRLLKNKIEIIGVGGVDSGESAHRKFLAGASYVQLYTGMVFQGPNIVGKIKKELKEILITDGIKNFREIIGKKQPN